MQIITTSMALIVISGMIICNCADAGTIVKEQPKEAIGQTIQTPGKHQPNLQNTGDLSQTKALGDGLPEDQNEAPLSQAYQNSITPDDLYNDIAPIGESENGIITYDPYEKFNRAIFSFNRFIDKIFIRPITLVYDKFLPSFIQRGIGNFFNNLATIPSIPNDILQLNIIRAFSDTWRFAINTTAGIGGLIDISGKLGMDNTNNDLQLTFMKWGAKKTPYLVLPFLGPTSFRDFIGLSINYEYLTIYPWIHPNRDRYALIGLWYVQTRDQLLQGDKLVDEAYDPYILVRSAYLQHREYLLGKVTGKTDIQEAETTSKIVR